MGLSRIFGLFAAVVSVSALAADPPIPRSNVSVNVNPTTGYYTVSNSTLRLPNGVSASPAAGGLPVVTKYSGGLQQTLPTGITIDAIKKSAPLPAVVRAKTETLKTGAKSLLRGGIGGMVMTAGLQKLLDGIDALIEDGQVVQRLPVHMTDPPAGALLNGVRRSYSGNPPYAGDIKMWEGTHGGSRYSWWCAPEVRGGSFIGGSASATGGSCYYLEDAKPEDGFFTSPLSESAIDDAVDNSYDPEPDDWRLLSPHIQPDDVEITSAPTLQGEPKTTTVFDADGNPHKVTTTNTWYDFDIRDNPSPSPALDMKTREETETYEDGVLTGKTTTESTASGGSGGAPPAEIDIPTDCDFMPTVCAFLEWYRDDDPPEEPDLSVLIDDRDFTESYTISGGSKQCPPPYELALPFIGQTYYLSFDFACDFASKIYYFIMAAAYIFAAYITIGVARNG